MKGELKKEDVVVVIFHDHGSRYVGKIFNDDWMRERGFLDKKKAMVKDVINKSETMDLLSIQPQATVEDAVKLITENNISQLPVIEGKEVKGSIIDAELFGKLLANPELKEKLVQEVMAPAFPMVAFNATIEEVSPLITKEVPAVLTRDQNEKLHIITKQDIIQSIC